MIIILSFSLTVTVCVSVSVSKTGEYYCHSEYHCIVYEYNMIIIIINIAYY